MSIRRSAANALAVVVLLCGTGVAAAAAAQDERPVTSEELAKRDKAMRERIDKLEKVVRNLREVIVQSRDTGQPVQVRIAADPDPEVVGVKRRIDDVEGSLAGLNGRLDEIDRNIVQLRRTLTDTIAARREQEDSIAKLSARIQALEAAAQAAAAAGPPPVVDAPEPAATPDAAFAQAKALLIANDYPAAARAFQDFVERFPDAPQAPEAQYWLGETLFVQDAYDEAAVAYIGAIRGWPKTKWAPNATLKLARALIASNKRADACSTLAELARNYPKLPPAVASGAVEARLDAKCR
jgi:tol-pal system protein YbgF